MVRRSHQLRLSVVLWLAWTWSSLGAVLPTTQLPPNQMPPVFRSGAYLVFVDAYPRRAGRIVEGLSASDFRVAEDGKPQSVEIFEFVGAGGAAAPANLTPVVAGFPLPGRLFILYLNRYFLTMEGARRSPAPLVSFLQEVLGPRDLVSWHSPDLPVKSLTFGQPLDRIEDLLRQSWRDIHDESPYPDGAVPVALSPRESLLTACYIGRTPSFERNKEIVRELVIRHRIDLVLSSLDELIGRAAMFGEPRVHVLFVSGSWALPREGTTKWAWGTDAQSIPEPVRPTPAPRRADPSSIDRVGCDAEYIRLQTMDAAGRFRDLLQRASRANVSFVTVDPYGLGALDPFSSRPLGSGSLDLLRTLAESTGGLASVGAGDLSASMRTLAAGVASYYLLGYYSTNTQFNGRYRTIDVKVTQPEVTVSARRGYTPPQKK